MNHKTHIYLMLGLAVVAGVLLLTGTAGGSAFTFIWLAGCMAMMFFMMRGGGNSEADTPRHGGPQALTRFLRLRP